MEISDGGRATVKGEAGLEVFVRMLALGGRSCVQARNRRQSAKRISSRNMPVSKSEQRRPSAARVVFARYGTPSPPIKLHVRRRALASVCCRETSQFRG